MHQLHPLTPFFHRSSRRLYTLALLGGLLLTLALIGVTHAEQSVTPERWTMAPSPALERPQTEYPDVRIHDIALSDAYVMIGRPFTITVSVTNDGAGAAADVELVSPVLPVLSVASVPPGCRHDMVEQSITCDVGTVHSLEHISFHMVFLATTSGWYTPSARVSTSTLDLNLVNNDGFGFLEIVPEDSALVSLGVRVDAACCRYPVGEQVTVTLIVSNHGPGTATGIKVNGWVPDHFSLVGGASSCVWEQGSRSFVCEFDDLPPEQTGEQAVVLLAEAPDVGGFGAYVSSASNDPNPYDNGAGASLDSTEPLPPYYDIAVTIQSYGGMYTGNTIQYVSRIAHSYDASGVVSNVVVTLTLAAEAEVSRVTEGCVHDAHLHRVVCRAVDLPWQNGADFNVGMDVVYHTHGTYTTFVEMTGDLPSADAAPENNSAVHRQQVRQDPGGIVGHVRGRFGPLDGIEVSVLSADSVCRGWRVVETDITQYQEGVYVFSYLEPGIYLVLFHDPSGVYADQYYAAAANIADARPVVVEPGTSVGGIDAQLVLATGAPPAAPAGIYLPLIGACQTE